MALTPDSSRQSASTGKDLDLALFGGGGSVSTVEEAPGMLPSVANISVEVSVVDERHS